MKKLVVRASKLITEDVIVKAKDDKDNFDKILIDNAKPVVFEF